MFKGVGLAPARGTHVTDESPGESMSAVLEPPRHRFSRVQYERMVEAGVFGPGDRLELLEGEIIDLVGQTLELCRGPGENGYSERRLASAEARFAPQGRPDRSLEVKDLLP
jgi:hypothetical protein